MNIAEKLLSSAFFVRGALVRNIKIGEVACHRISFPGDHPARSDTGLIRQYARAIASAEKLQKESLVLNEHGVLVRGHKKGLYTQYVTLFVNDFGNLTFFSTYDRFGLGFCARVEVEEDLPHIAERPEWYRKHKRGSLVMQPIRFITPFVRR